MGGGTSLSSHRAGFGVFWSKALSKSTAESAFADSVNCNDYESCHCEVPEARRHIGLWSNASSHCEERSDVAIAKPVKRNNNAITTSNAAHSPRNDNTVMSLRGGFSVGRRVSEANPARKVPVGRYSAGTPNNPIRPERSVAIAKPIKCDSKRKKAAFTLAEVLITLAIIGIVAALTIPTLVQNYQERAWNTASQVFQRKLGEALRVMNVQGTLAGYTTTEAFVDELSKHIKITRICENDDITTCFSDTVTWGDEEVDMSKVKKAKNFGQNDWDTNTVAVQFANGINSVIAYNPSCTQNQFSNNEITINENGIGTNCLAILYDVDGFKNPNTQQKDLRGLNVTSLGGSNCAIELSDGTCFTAPFYPTAVTKAECDQLVADGYPIKECSTENDYWAGAVKACKDMGSSLPSQEQLDQLARDLYPGTEITTGTSDGIRDNDLAMEWKFITSPGSSFYVWSSEEGSDNIAYYRSFYSVLTYGSNLSRNNSTNQAVCLAN